MLQAEFITQVGRGWFRTTGTTDRRRRASDGSRWVAMRPNAPFDATKTKGGILREEDTALDP